MKIYDVLYRRVEPSCRFCANNVDGRCAALANGTNARVDLGHPRNRGFTANDSRVQPGNSCNGKLFELGIMLDGNEIPFIPRTTELVRANLMHYFGRLKRAIL